MHVVGIGTTIIGSQSTWYTMSGWGGRYEPLRRCALRALGEMRITSPWGDGRYEPLRRWSLRAHAEMGVTSPCADGCYESLRRWALRALAQMGATSPCADGRYEPSRRWAGTSLQVSKVGRVFVFVTVIQTLKRLTSIFRLTGFNFTYWNLKSLVSVSWLHLTPQKFFSEHDVTKTELVIVNLTLWWAILAICWSPCRLLLWKRSYKCILGPR